MLANLITKLRRFEKFGLATANTYLCTRAAAQHLEWNGGCLRKGVRSGDSRVSQLETRS
jgi:hypothetical protein